MIKLIRPMLATLAPKPFHRRGWVYEEKYDGLRALAYRRRRVRLYSRNLNELTTEFAEIARALEDLPEGPFVLERSQVQVLGVTVSRVLEEEQQRSLRLLADFDNSRRRVTMEGTWGRYVRLSRPA
jgi:hypothetical protein